MFNFVKKVEQVFNFVKKVKQDQPAQGCCIILLYTLSCSFPNKSCFFTCLQYKSFETTVGKGETACYEYFLLFSYCFLPFWQTFCHFHQIWIVFCKLLIWTRPRLCPLDKELNNWFKPCNSFLHNNILALSKSEAFANKFHCGSVGTIFLWKGRKHCWKRRKCPLPVFFSFHKMFPNILFLRVIKTQNCLEKD